MMLCERGDGMDGVEVVMPAKRFRALILPRADAFGDARRSRSPASASPTRWTRLKAAFWREISPEPFTGPIDPVDRLLAGREPWAAKGGPDPASFRVAAGVSAKPNQNPKHRAHVHSSLGFIGRGWAWLMIDTTWI